MARIMFVGPYPAVSHPVTGEEVAAGQPIDVDDDVLAGSLVGYGHGLWRYVDDNGEHVPPVDLSVPDEDAADEAAVDVEQPAPTGDPDRSEQDATTSGEEQ